MDKTVKRRVEHQKYECLDCAAGVTLLAKFHKDERHTGKPDECDECTKYVTWVSSYSPK